MEDEIAKRRIGSVLSTRYKVEGLLGAGGMATVYLGRHRNGNPVAIKVLHPHLGVMRDIASRFLKEGYVANAVGHPGTVRVLDDDVAEDGAPYLVMELLEGKTLDQLRRDSPSGTLPVAEALSYAHELLSVLQAAHDKGIVHRDIKPDNVFVTTEGKLKVLDFGIARILTGPGASNTRTGNVMGTPAYLPPEQALGLTKEIDGRTDQWAVGAMLFKLLSGKYVHEGETPEHVVVLTASRPARSLATVAPQLPADVVAIVDRALSFEKRDRFPDANAMLQAIRAHVAGGASNALGFEKTQPLHESALPVQAQLIAQTSPLASSIVQPPRPTAEPRAEGGILTAGAGRDSVANTASAVASTTSGASGTSRLSRGLLGVAAALALLGPAAWYLRRTTNLVSGASAPETAAPSTASLDGPLRTTPSAASATPPSAIANQSAGPAATAPAQTASSATGANTVRPLHAASAKPVSSARLAPSASAQAPVAPAKPNCDPPFIVDPESGARKVKPGC